MDLRGPKRSFLQRLHAYAGLFREDFRRTDQARWAHAYLQGLLRDAGRKNVATLARRLVPPAGCGADDTAQALQNFINQSPWDEQQPWRRFRALLARRFGHPEGVFVIDDLTFLKQGQHSVGVQRQYSSALARKVNCQVAVAVHYVSRRGDFPLALRLYLPKDWLNAPRRLDAAGVPAECHRFATKGEIALELLDQVRAEEVPGRCVVAGAGYGTSPGFCEGLAARGLFYLVKVPEDVAAFAEKPLAVPDGHNGRAPAAVLSNLPAATSVRRAARLWDTHPRARAAYQRMRDELGLDHFEGRSWRGFHHHLCLVMLAYGFLLTEQERRGPSGGGRKGPRSLSRR
jgi:SRSO17 transposase